jgi:hypothetical protein
MTAHVSDSASDLRRPRDSSANFVARRVPSAGYYVDRAGHESGVQRERCREINA